MTLSTEHAYSGNTSIKIVSGGGGYNHGFLSMDLATFPALQQEMFGRIMLYVTDENANAGDFTFLQAEGYWPQPESGAPPGTHIMYRGRIDRRYDHVFANYDTWIDENLDNVSDWPTDCQKHPTITEAGPPPLYVMPKNEWVCVQWHMKRSTDHIDISLNETHLIGIRVNGNGNGCANNTTQGGVWFAPQKFEFVNVGIEQYSEDALPRTVYIDDIIMDSRLVECDGSLTDPSHH